MTGTDTVSGSPGGTTTDVQQVADRTGQTFITFPVVRTAPGGACATTGGQWVDVDDAAALQRQLTDDFTVYVNTSFGVAPDGQSVVSACTAAVAVYDPTPALAFADETIALLPRPVPEISGPFAITGLPVHLDTNRPTVQTFTRTLTLGSVTAAVTIEARARYDVDWGPVVTGPHTVPGGPWHEGPTTADDVTHVYDDANDATTLGVTDTWDVTVSIPGRPSIRLTETLPPVSTSFAVRQVRAVRDR